MLPKTRKVSLISLVAFVLMATLFSGAVAGVEKKISESFDVAPGGNLTLETERGSVEIRTSAGSRVEIELLLEAKTRDEDRAKDIFNDFEVEFDQDGDDVNIIAEYYGRKSDWKFWEDRRNRLKINFLISVPKQYNIYVHTSGGSVAVDDLEGKVQVKTSGGSLYFEDIKGPVKGKTSGGSIELQSCVGTADVSTSGGSITIGRVEGEVIAHTSGGSISVEEVMGAIDASTSGGSVSAYISSQPEDDCRLTTSGGNVTVHLAENVNLDIDAKTSGGRVRTDFPVTVRGDLSKTKLNAKINDGGPELYLRTSGGNINLREM
jgi:hypothetical protein